MDCTSLFTSGYSMLDRTMNQLLPSDIVPVVHWASASTGVMVTSRAPSGNRPTEVVREPWMNNNFSARSGSPD